MKKRLKIGLFIDVFFPMIDGVVMVVDNYAKRMQDFADVIVFAPESLDKEYKDNFNYEVVRCKSIKMPFVDYSVSAPILDKEFNDKLNNANLDIVHIHSPFIIGNAGIKYAKVNNVPVIATMHSQYKKDFKRVVKLNKISNMLTKRIIRVYNKCNECWAVNAEVARIFYEEYGYKVLPYVENNATDMLPVENKIKSNQLVNKKYDIEKDDLVFLFVGRINKLKNIFFIADALKILKKEKLKFKMLYVGSGQDENKLKNKLKRNGLTNLTVLCGRVTDRELMKSIYARADLFLFPSMYDASSLVQIEAASQSTPTVFIEGAATASSVTNNVNGFIAKANKKAYAEKILEVLRDRKLYLKVSKGSNIDLYRTWDQSVKEVYAKYLQVIKIHKKNIIRKKKNK